MNGFDWLRVSIEWQAFSTQVAMTLLHFVWQALIVGSLLAIALRALRDASANSRYLASCFALFILPVVAVCTFVAQTVPTESESLVATETRSSDSDTNSLAPGITPLSGARKAGPTTDSVGLALSGAELEHSAFLAHDSAESSITTAPWREIISRFSPILTVSYVFGVFVLLARMLLAIWRAYSLRRLGEPIVTGELPVLAKRLAKEMGLRVAPLLAYCERVSVPVVVGILKPTILLPAAMATNLSMEELAAILSHELAHIRRFDLAVHLMQRVVGSLLFFPPVVWWVGRSVNTERENCCDDLAVAAGIGDTEYVGALLKMAELCLQSRGREMSRQVAMMAADGSQFSQLSRRVERLLKIRTAPRFAASRIASLAAACVVAVSIASVAGLNLLPRTEAAPQQNEKEDAEVDDAVPDVEKELVLPNEEVDGINWGDAVEGVRMGIRSASFAKRATSFRHGDWLRYEVWLKNEREHAIEIPGDPRMLYRPLHQEGRINVIGSTSWMSFSIPQSAVEAARVVIPAGATRQLRFDPQCPIREVGAKPGRFGPSALKLAPGKYPLRAEMQLGMSLYAADGDRESTILDLQSGNTDIQILPAARLQLRRVNEVSKKPTPEQLAKDPSRQAITWIDNEGKSHEVVLNLNGGVIMEGDDLLSFASLQPLDVTDGSSHNHNLVVELKKAAISRIAKETERLIREQERRTDTGSKPMLAIFLDGQVLSATQLQRPIRQQRANIPCNLHQNSAALLRSFLTQRLPTYPSQTAWLNLPREDFRVGASLDVSQESERSSGPLRMRFLLHNQSGKTKTVRLELSNGTTVTKTLKQDEKIPIASPIEINNGDSVAGEYEIAKLANPDGSDQHRGWAVTRKVDGGVAMEKNIDSPIVSLTVTKNSNQPWEAALLKPTKVFADHLNVMAVGIDAQATTVISVATKKEVTVRTWDVGTAALRKQVTLNTEAHANKFHNAGLTISPDLSKVLAVVNGQIHIWDVESGKLNTRLPKKENLQVSARGLSCTDDMSLVAAGIEHTYSGVFGGLPDCALIVWDTEKQSILREFTHPNALQITSVAISPDGRWLASGCQTATTCVFDVQSGKRIKRLENSNPGHVHPNYEVSSEGVNQILSLAFSPDGRHLAIGDLLSVKLVETETGRVIHQFISPFRYGASRLVFSNDGDMLARTATDKVVPIWSTKTGDVLAELPTESNAGAFSRNGKWFATGITDRKQALSLWRIADE